MTTLGNSKSFGSNMVAPNGGKTISRSGCKGFASKEINRKRTPHITMLCAISPNVGLIHHTIIVGGARQSHFDQFIQELFDCDFGQPLVQCQEFGKTYIVLDNVPCHRGVEVRLNDIIPMNFELVRLPPYSCELNPIEFTFNNLKAHVKRALNQHGPYIHIYTFSWDYIRSSKKAIAFECLSRSDTKHHTSRYT